MFVFHNFTSNDALAFDTLQFIPFEYNRRFPDKFDSVLFRSFFNILLLLKL